MDATWMNLEDIKLKKANRSQTNTVWLHLFEWSKLDKHKNIACQGVQGGDKGSLMGRVYFIR